jgi:hypothetical protein
MTFRYKLNPRTKLKYKSFERVLLRALQSMPREYGDSERLTLGFWGRDGWIIVNITMESDSC